MSEDFSDSDGMYLYGIALRKGYDDESNLQKGRNILGDSKGYVNSKILPKKELNKDIILF
jgi:hypothetical protein